MAKKVGTLIKEARTAAGLTQEALAKKIKGVSASDISLAERGEKTLTQAALKEIAKATGVTQKSLLDAAKSDSAGNAKKTTSDSGKKTSTKKTTSDSGKKTSTKKSASGSGKKASTSSAGKTASGRAKKTAASSEFKVSAEEKKIIQAYREADNKIRATVKMLLLGTEGLTSGSGIAGYGDLPGSGDLVSSLLGSVRNLLG